MSDTETQQYTVKAGDTLWSIAEQFYGLGQCWPWVAAKNPLARAGVLYEGQRLAMPKLPARPQDPRARSPALPLGHAAVRIRFDGRQPLFRYVGFGVMGVSGFAGELTFYRDGPLNLVDLTPGRLLQYRLEQVAWAEGLFVEHFCTPALESDWPLYTTRSPLGPRITQHPCELRGPGYSICGRIGEWRQVTVHDALLNGPPTYSKMLAVNPSALFRAATLVLADAAPPGAPPERALPLGRVLRAACPHLIAPATLWTLAPDESFFPQTTTPTLPAPDGPLLAAAEASPAPAPAEPPPARPKRKKAARKGRKKRPAPGGDE
jgi:hypothetical protein